MIKYLDPEISGLQLITTEIIFVSLNIFRTRIALRLMKSRTLRLCGSSFFLIQLSACCCGSIHMGKRDARVVRMPFWMESSSGGSPSDVHLWMTKYSFWIYLIDSTTYSVEIKWSLWNVKLLQKNYFKIKWSSQ